MKGIVKTDGPVRCLCFLCYKNKCFSPPVLVKIARSLLKFLFKLCRIYLWRLLTVYLQEEVRWFPWNLCGCVAGACGVVTHAQLASWADVLL